MYLLSQKCDHFNLLSLIYSISPLDGHNNYVACGPNYIYNYLQTDYDGLLSCLLQYDFNSVYNWHGPCNIESAYYYYLPGY